MAYQKINWENKPSTKTPIKAENLNHMEDGIEDVSLNKADAIISSDSGTTIVARDSAEFPLNGLAVYGRSEQETTSGAQLIDFSKVIFSSCTLEDSEKGIIKSNIVDGYYCEISSHYLANYFFENRGKTFTFRADSNPLHIAIVIYGNKGENEKIQEADTEGTKVSITIDEDYTSISKIELRLNRNVHNAFADTTTLISGIMLCEGNEDKAYEPYTGGAPSPSPDYPQPIVNAGDGLYRGKNLLNNTASNITEYGISCTVNADKTIILNGTASADYYLKIGEISLNVGEYILSGCPTSGGTLLQLYVEKDGAQFATDSGNGINFELSKTSVIKVFVFVGNETVLTDKLFSPMIRLATIADGTYEPYTGGVPVAYPKGIEVAVMGKNLFNTTGREVREPGGEHINTSVRDNLNGSGIYIGVSPNNYFYPGAINSYVIGREFIVINSKSSGYGIGFDFVVSPGQQYALNYSPSTASVTFYTEQGKYISFEYIPAQNTVTVPSTAYFMLITFFVSDEHVNSDITINNIQLEIGSNATAYEPYRLRQTVTLASKNGLPGIPVEFGGNYTDADGQQWICDTVEYRDGQAVYVQRVKEYKYDGSEDEKWCLGYGSGDGVNNRFGIEEINDFATHNSLARNAFCDSFIYELTTAIPQENHFRIVVFDTYAYLLFNISTEVVALDNLEVWKTYLQENPITVLVPLSDSTETPLTDTEAAQLVTLQSYKPTTVITNDAGAGMDVEYTADTKNYIDNKFAELQTALAVTNAQLI